MNETNFIVLSLYNRKPNSDSRDKNDLRVKKCVKSLVAHRIPFKFLNETSAAVDLHPISRLYEFLSTYYIYYEYVVIADFRKFMWVQDTDLLESSEDTAVVLDRENKLDFMIVKSRLLWSYLNNAERMPAYYTRVDNYDVFDQLPISVIGSGHLPFLEIVPESDYRLQQFYYHCQNQLTYNFPFCSMVKFERMVYKKEIFFAVVSLVFLVTIIQYYK